MELTGERMFKWRVLGRILAAALASALLAASAWAGETVVIGYTGPLSGGAALYGKNTLAGLELAAKEINDAGGISIAQKVYVLKIVALDDQYSPSLSGVNGKRLSAQYKAPVVFVSHSAGASALQVFNERDNFIVAAYTSVPAISQRGNSLTFRIPPSFPLFINTFVRTEMKKFGKKLAIATADHDYARAWVEAFAPAWKEAGGIVSSVNLMSYNKDTDFYSGVSRALADHPDVMLVGGASEPTALVIKQARELGFQGGFAVLDQAKMDEMARVIGGLGPLEGAVGAMPLVNDPSPGVSMFVEKYRKQAGKDPGSEVAFHYSALYAIVEAMKLATTVSDPRAIFAKLNEAFAKLPVASNPSRISGLDANGAALSPIAVALVEKGRIVSVDMTPTTP
jgi:branched-chain amino acid transport system substrate-binding protein